MHVLKHVHNPQNYLKGENNTATRVKRLDTIKPCLKL